MASGKVLYAVRIPVDLKRLLDSAAKSGGVSTSQLVIDACWKYLDGGSSKRPAPEPSGRTAAFMDQARIQVEFTPNINPAYEDERPICTYKEWFEGEQYACGLRIHSAKVKHTRGVVVS